ncbi:hypothetical protein BH24GEM3_BH24GEM3_09160 [soil metagenome]
MSSTPPASVPFAAHPEAELLLCCARTRLLPETGERIRTLLQGNLDWKYVLQAARLHRILPLLYWHLHTHFIDEIPEGVLARLKEDFYANAAQNLFLTSELLRLLGLLREHGISAVPFKGLALAAAVYGDTSLRPAGDLDLMLHKHDVLRARDVLLSAGYQRQFPFSAAREAAQLRASHQYGFVREDGRVLVELQWGVTVDFLPSPLDVQGLWTRLRSVSLGGTSVPTLAPEDLLLLLCVHGTKHCWSRLAWICDVAELLRMYPELEWKWVVDQARARGGRRMLFLGLLLAHDLLDAPLPAQLTESVQRDRQARVLAREVRGLLFPGAHELIGGLHPAAEYRIPFNLRSRERLRDKARCFIGLTLHLSAPRAGDKARPPLPRSLTFLRYCLWPIRLLRKYGLTRSHSQQ